MLTQSLILRRYEEVKYGHHREDDLMSISKASVATPKTEVSAKVSINEESILFLVCQERKGVQQKEWD